MVTYTFKTRTDATAIDISSILRTGTQTSTKYQGFTYASTSYTNSSNGSIQGFTGMPTDMAAPNAQNYTSTTNINVPAQATYATVMGRGGGGGSGGGSGGCRNMSGSDAWKHGALGGSGAAAAFITERLNLGTSNENKTATITIGGGGAGGIGGNSIAGFGPQLRSGWGGFGGDGGSTNIQIKNSSGSILASMSMPGGAGGERGREAITNQPQTGFMGTEPAAANKTHHINQTNTLFEPSTVIEQYGDGASVGGGGGSGGVYAGNQAFNGNPGTDGQSGAISIIWIYGGG